MVKTLALTLVMVACGKASSGEGCSVGSAMGSVGCEPINLPLKHTPTPTPTPTPAPTPKVSEKVTIKVKVKTTEAMKCYRNKEEVSCD